MGNKTMRVLMVCLTVGIFIATIIFITVGFPPLATAQQKQIWKPEGEISTIVCSGVGSAYDILARKVAQYSSERFGVAMIVSNMSGGGGILGIDKVATARPNGRTIGLAPNGNFVESFLREKSGEWSFRWRPHEVEIVIGVRVPSYIVVTGINSPFKSWEDVRNYKEAVRFGNTGSIDDCMPAIRDLLDHGKEVRVANFKGTPQSRLALESGDTHLWSSASTVSVLDPIKEGTMRPLLIYSAERDPRFPNVPTHIEVGMPERYKYNRSVRIFFTAPGTPSHILEGLRTGLKGILEDPQVLKWSEEISLPTKTAPPEEVKEHVKSSIEFNEEFADLIQRYGG